MTLRVLVMSNGERVFPGVSSVSLTVNPSKEKKLLSGSPNGSTLLTVRSLSKEGEHFKFPLLSIFPKMFNQPIVLEI